MKLISYAQNFEDVLLWRALGHIADGFYIDAGANDPVDHSVTKAFYDAGWHGINIEPLPALQQAFRAQRPRDINLAIAVGADNGSLDLFDVPAVNGWASPDQAVADAHRAEGFEVTRITVPVRTLASICEEHVSGPIHFLKIDVEGFEGEVLRGMDFARWRPWILVIEATMPNSRVTNHESWEALVTSQGYQFAWFDGLNRYYVAQEQPQLRAALTIQPNVFDNFISHHLKQAWADVEAETNATDEALHRIELMTARHTAAVEQHADETAKHEQLVIEMQQQIEAAHQNAAKVASWARDMEQTLQAIYQSSSWRITQPLRAASDQLRHLRRGTLHRQLLARVTGNERIRRLLIPILLRMPWLAKRVSNALASIKHSTPAAGSPEELLPDNVRALPLSARKVLADLRQACRPTPPAP